MGQFRFRLERVRRWRERQQREAEQTVARSNLALQREQHHLNEVERAAEAVRQRCAREGTGLLTPRRLLCAAQRLELLGVRQTNQRQILAVSAQQLAEDQGKLRAAMQAREVLDRLRDARLREHRRDEVVAEQRETDAIVTSRWARADSRTRAA